MPDIFDKINNLPEEIQDYLDSSELAEINEKLAQKYKFSIEQRRVFLTIILKIFIKTLSSKTLISILSKDLQLETDKDAVALAKDIQENILFPVRDYFNGDIDILGIKKSEQVVSLTDQVIIKYKLNISNNFRDRFEFAINSFLKNARTNIQFKNILIKNIKSGGLGMNEEMADKIIEFLVLNNQDEEYNAEQKTKSTSKADMAFNVKIESPKPKLAEAPKPAPMLLKKEADFKAEEKEAELLESKVENLKSETENIVTNIKQALKETNLNFPSTELNKRFQDLVDSRLRNVRTSTQALDRMILEPENGGLGMSRQEADRVSEILNKFIILEEKKIHRDKISGIKHGENIERQRVEMKKNLTDKQEKENLDSRFVKLVSKSKKASLNIKQNGVPNFPTPKVENKSESKFTEKKSNPKSKIPIVESEAPYFKTKQAVKIELPELPKGPGGRPVIEDIAFTPKLSGPIEEIGKMTIEDFRRLSVDPKEVLLKINDKLNFLRDESFVKYQKGISAWLKSPIYMEYLDIIDKGLESNRKITDIIKEKNTLTQNEFDAIMDSRIVN